MLKEFEQIVGKQMLSAFAKMLEDIGPDARTHRIGVVLSAILKYAYDQLPRDCEPGSLGDAMLALIEDPHLVHEGSDEAERAENLIVALREKAGMQNQREDYTGTSYTIAEKAILEFTNWYAMPWEDYI